MYHPEKKRTMSSLNWRALFPRNSMDTEKMTSETMDIYSALVDIMGRDRVSNSPEELYIYSRDSGAQLPRTADYVVMPRTVEEVRDILRSPLSLSPRRVGSFST
jgi:hypothetical protein